MIIQLLECKASPAEQWPTGHSAAAWASGWRAPSHPSTSEKPTGSSDTHTHKNEAIGGGPFTDLGMVTYTGATNGSGRGRPQQDALQRGPEDRGRGRLPEAAPSLPRQQPLTKTRGFCCGGLPPRVGQDASWPRWRRTTATRDGLQWDSFSLPVPSGDTAACS